MAVKNIHCMHTPSNTYLMSLTITLIFPMTLDEWAILESICKHLTVLDFVAEWKWGLSENKGCWVSHRSETLIYASSPQLWSVYTPAQRGTPTVCNDIMGHRGAEYLTKVDKTKIIQKRREERRAVNNVGRRSVFLVGIVGAVVDMIIRPPMQ